MRLPKRLFQTKCQVSTLLHCNNYSFLNWGRLSRPWRHRFIDVAMFGLTLTHGKRALQTWTFIITSSDQTKVKTSSDCERSDDFNEHITCAFVILNVPFHSYHEVEKLFWSDNTSFPVRLTKFDIVTVPFRLKCKEFLQSFTFLFFFYLLFSY